MNFEDECPVCGNEDLLQMKNMKVCFECICRDIRELKENKVK